MEVTIESQTPYSGGTVSKVKTRENITKITVDGEEWVPRVYPDTYSDVPNEPQFKVGDFVRVIEPFPESVGPKIGDCGKILEGPESVGGTFGVEFCHSFEFGHDLCKTSTPGHGWYFPPSHLELI